MDEVAGRALDLLTAAVDSFLGLDLGVLSGPELAELLAGAEVQLRRFGAVDTQLVHEISERRLAGEFGRTSTADLLAERLRIDRSEARSRVLRADELGPRRELSGAPLPPLWPSLAAAQAAGAISAGHARVILQVLAQLPDGVPLETPEEAARLLIGIAQQFPPAAVAQSGRELLDRLRCQYGEAPSDDEVQRHRGLNLRTHPCGGSELQGRLDDETAALCSAALDALSAPVPADETGQRDPRTASQRRHDALREVLLRVLRSNTLPDSGGVAAGVLVHVSVDDLVAVGRTSSLADPVDRSRRARLVRTSGGGQLSMAAVERLAGELHTVVFDRSGAALYLGRERRLASPAQRKVLAARDRGCSFPGCTRPVAWCEAHHVVPWSAGGPTDIDNLCLLCAFHHREFAGRGWTVVMTDGLPHWLPPAWYDPARTPIRKVAHHLPGIDFGEIPRDTAGTSFTSRALLPPPDTPAAVVHDARSGAPPIGPGDHSPPGDHPPAADHSPPDDPSSGDQPRSGDRSFPSIDSPPDHEPPPGGGAGSTGLIAGMPGWRRTRIGQSPGAVRHGPRIAREGSGDRNG